MQDKTIQYIFTNNVQLQSDTMLYNTIQISLHCNVIQYPVILNNAIEHTNNKIPCKTTKYHLIQQNTDFAFCKMLLPILAVLWRGSETALAFYKLQRDDMKLGRVVDPKQPSLSVKICLPDLAQGYIHYSSNNDSINCTEISAVTWFRHNSGLLQIPFQIPLFRNSLRSYQHPATFVPFP